MPRQTEEFVSPTLPDFGQIRTFEDVRTALGRMMEYLQRLNNAHHNYFAQLRQNLNQASTEQGQDIVSAATITVSNFMHVITGTATVTTILGPQHFVGQLMLVSKDGFYLATGGNISLFQTPNFLGPTANVMLTYIPSQQLWVADTCRLKTAPGTLNVGGRITGNVE
jgi:ABC-type transporter Mla subunit MlaD